MRFALTSRRPATPPEVRQLARLIAFLLLGCLISAGTLLAAGPSSFAATMTGPATPKDRGASGWSQPPGGGWWDGRYALDYALIGAGGLAYLISHNLSPREQALFGPKYDPAAPMTLLAPANNDRIGRRYLMEGTGETVPSSAVVALLGIGGVWLAVQEGVPWVTGDSGDAQLLHDALIGYLETIALTAGSTEIAKTLVGRLRPDYQDRVRRLHCASTELDMSMCPDGALEPLGPSPADIDHAMLDGRRSFWSGHSAHSFNMATYISLAIGGRFVWGADASPTSAAFGILGQTALVGTATFIAASRVEDGRHHPSDVLTGAAVGIGLAQLSYWRRFGSDGRPRPKPDPAATTFDFEPGPGLAGLALTVRYR